MVMRSRLSRRSQVRGRVPVFSYDLAEHLQATTSDVPAVVKICTEFVEKYGVTDGIYRLSGVTSNVNKLRLAFEKGTEPNLLAEPFVSDIHCVTSVCKQYFRLLPDPLLTYRLYSQFDEAVRETDIDLRLGRIRNAISQLPPPNYRTLIYLMRHLETMASHSVKTNMHVRNLAIVWAPNLLRSQEMEGGNVSAMAFLEVRVQSVVLETIIGHAATLFDGGPRSPLPCCESGTPPQHLLTLAEAQTTIVHKATADDLRCVDTLSERRRRGPVRVLSYLIARAGSLSNWRRARGVQLRDVRATESTRQHHRFSQSMESLLQGGGEDAIRLCALTRSNSLLGTGPFLPSLAECQQMPISATSPCKQKQDWDVSAETNEGNFSADVKATVENSLEAPMEKLVVAHEVSPATEADTATKLSLVEKTSPAQIVVTTQDMTPATDADTAAEIAPVNCMDGEEKIISPNETAPVGKKAPTEVNASGDEIAPVHDIVSVDEMLAAQEMVPVNKIILTDEMTPVDEIATAQLIMISEESATAEIMDPVENMVPLQELAQTQEMVLAEEMSIAEEMTKPQKTVLIRETAPTEDTSPAIRMAGTKELTSNEEMAVVQKIPQVKERGYPEEITLDEQMAVVAEIAPTKQTAPMETITPVKQKASVEKKTAAPEIAPTQKLSPVQVVALRQDEAPVQDEALVLDEGLFKNEAPVQDEAPVLDEGLFKDEAPVQYEALVQDMTVVQDVAPAQDVDQDVALVVQDMAPVVQDVAPVVQDVAPVEQDVAPVEQDVAPVEQDVALVEQDMAPVVQDMAPVVQDMAPVKQDMAPVEQDVALVEQDVAPAQDVAQDVAPVVQDMAPVVQDVAPVVQDVAPVEQDMALVEQDVAPVEQDMVPVVQDVSLVEVYPAQEVYPMQEVCPVQDEVSVQNESPVQNVALAHDLVQEVAPAQDVALAQDVFPVQYVALAQDVTQDVAPLVQEVALLQDVAPLWEQKICPLQVVPPMQVVAPVQITQTNETAPSLENDLTCDAYCDSKPSDEASESMIINYAQKDEQCSEESLNNSTRENQSFCQMQEVLTHQDCEDLHETMPPQVEEIGKAHLSTKATQAQESVPHGGDLIENRKKYSADEWTATRHLFAVPYRPETEEGQSSSMDINQCSVDTSNKKILQEPSISVLSQDNIPELPSEEEYFSVNQEDSSCSDTQEHDMYGVSREQQSNLHEANARLGPLDTRKGLSNDESLSNNILLEQHEAFHVQTNKTGDQMYNEQFLPMSETQRCAESQARLRQSLSTSEFLTATCMFEKSCAGRKSKERIPFANKVERDLVRPHRHTRPPATLNTCTYRQTLDDQASFRQLKQPATQYLQSCVQEVDTKDTCGHARHKKQSKFAESHLTNEIDSGEVPSVCEDELGKYSRIKFPIKKEECGCLQAHCAEGSSAEMKMCENVMAADEPQNLCIQEELQSAAANRSEEVKDYNRPFNFNAAVAANLARIERKSPTVSMAMPNQTLGHEQQMTGHCSHLNVILQKLAVTASKRPKRYVDPMRSSPKGHALASHPACENTCQTAPTEDEQYNSATEIQSSEQRHLCKVHGKDFHAIRQSRDVICSEGSVKDGKFDPELVFQRTTNSKPVELAHNNTNRKPECTPNHKSVKDPFSRERTNLRKELKISNQAEACPMLQPLPNIWIADSEKTSKLMTTSQPPDICCTSYQRPTTSLSTQQSPSKRFIGLDKGTTHSPIFVTMHYVPYRAVILHSKVVPVIRPQPQLAEPVP